MYYMTLTAKPTAPDADDRLIPASDREHLVTVICGLWMTIGLFLDGAFHQDLEGETESFLTPWHAVFYAGFTASALWIASMSRRRNGGRFDWRLRHLPPGYELARPGLALFGVGAIGDAAWHGAFGVERGIDALLSPTHLLLFAGLVLILTVPYRAATTNATTPSPWLIVGSLTSATTLIGFFLNFAWGLGIAAHVRTGYDPVSEVGETHAIAGVASMLVTTGVLIGSARLLAACRPPAGAFTVLLGTTAALVSAAFDEDIEGVGAAVVAGVALDLLTRRRAQPAVGAAATAVILWTGYLGALAIDGIEWQPEIWMGAVVLNAMAAYLIGSTQPAPRDTWAVVRVSAPGPSTTVDHR